MGKNGKLYIFRKRFQHVISKLADALKLNDLMKLHENQRPGSLFDLCQRTVRFQTNLVFLKNC